MINEENLGVSATVGIERSETPRHLPVHPLISPDGKEISLTTTHNAVPLPAGFVLRLSSDTPLEVSKYHEIVAITGIGFLDQIKTKAAPLLQLITRNFSNDVLDSSNNRGLFVVSFVVR